MSSQNKATVEVDIKANIQSAQDSIKELENSLGKLDLGTSVETGFSKTILKLRSELNNMLTRTSSGPLDQKALKEQQAALERINKSIAELSARAGSKGVIGAGLKNDKLALNALDKAVQAYDRSVSNAGRGAWAAKNREIQQQLDIINELQRTLDSDKAKKTGIESRLDSAKKAVEEIKQKILEYEEIQKRLSEDSKFRTKNDGSVDTRSNVGKQYAENAKALAEYRTALAAAEKEEKNASKAMNGSKWQELNANIKNGEATLDGYKIKLQELKTELDNITKVQFDQVLNQLKNAKGIEWNFDLNSIKSIDNLRTALDNLRNSTSGAAQQQLDAIRQIIENVSRAAGGMGDNLNDAANNLVGLTTSAEDLAQVGNKVTNFFKVGTAINLFKKAIRSAYETVKELDAAMTETAVVTSYTVADMWEQLGSYSARANELGVSIKDVYESSTLYYQQGLNTVQVTALATETLKMARIAGLDAAEATDRRLKCYAA